MSNEKPSDKEIPSNYQPKKAELEADLRIPDATPDELLEAVINYSPRQDA